jgi:uncharacterized protein YqjF (DUF2071 family)
MKNGATYKETLNPPLSWMSFILFMYLSIAVAIWGAFEMKQAVVTLAALLATLPYLWMKLRMVITIDQNELRIDRAHIELKYLKNPAALDEATYKALRTVNSDARAFHITRPWLKTGVQVFVNDERDQTSYWLIGSKKAADLISNLN